MRVVWNGIVKNEINNLPRLINSMLPHIEGAVVVDTGSTDGTQAMIRTLFASADKPLELVKAEFQDFSQARNLALECARTSTIPWDYLLLADADMEFVVTDPQWLNGHTGIAYDMKQIGGAVSYTNRRLVSRQAHGKYLGVTHEYLDVESAGVLEGAHFIDHATGSNRTDKFIRDIALIELALEHETNQGLIHRYHFYLAQSYFDAGQFEKAIEHYEKRIAFGGFPEECWFAQVRLAQAHEKLKHPAEFVFHMLRAYEMRPHRAESLWDLARFYRERGENFTSLAFSEPALTLPRPKEEMLFVNDWTYRYGVREEFSICAYYDKRKRDRGRAVTNELVLDGSDQARGNSYWYLQPLATYVSSVHAERLDFTAEPGWTAMNPSITTTEFGDYFLVRTVNYTITPEGWYVIDGKPIADDNPIRTRNYVGMPGEWRELLSPENFDEPPAFAQVRGFEDSRIFQWRGLFHTLSCVRELTPEGWCEQVLASFALEGPNMRLGNAWRLLQPPGDRRHEKNWMPWVVGGERLQFVYRLGTLLDSTGQVVAKHDVPFDVSHISGGSQVIRVGPGLYLAVVHEAGHIPGRATRFYQHRFVVFEPDGRVHKISLPFSINHKGIEFVAGIGYAIERRELMISYGVDDKEAWFATMRLDQVMAFINGGRA